MQLKSILMTIFGLVLAGGSIFASEAMLNRANNTASATEQPVATTITLIAAATDIPFGSIIERDNLKPVEWPVGSVPVGAFDDANKLLGPEGTAPRRATQSILAGDVIVEDKVSRFGAGVTLTSAVSDGFRAVAVKVSAETAVGGFVSPGNRVDIVLTQGRGATLRTGTILQDIRVLGIDQNADESKRGAQTARTITVEVTPRGGQILALSQQAGILSLTLRNDSAFADDDDLEQITLDDVWGIAEAIPAPVVAPVEKQTVRVRRGVTEQEVNF